MATPKEEREAALATYKSACAEFEQAEAQWYPHLVTTGVIANDPIAAESAFDRLTRANQARQDALDSLWVAWRNRPDSAEVPS